jgi:hypothetical protein
MKKNNIPTKPRKGRIYKKRSLEKWIKTNIKKR